MRKQRNQFPPLSEDSQFHEVLRGTVADAIALLQSKGRPNEQDWTAARHWIDVLRSDADAMFAEAIRLGKAERFVSGVSITLAVLAHQEGGVDLWGLHFEASSPLRADSVAPCLRGEESGPEGGAA